MAARAKPCGKRHAWVDDGPYLVCRDCARALDLRRLPRFQATAIIAACPDEEMADRLDAVLAASGAAGRYECPTCGREG